MEFILLILDFKGIGKKLEVADFQKKVSENDWVTNRKASDLHLQKDLGGNILEYRSSHHQSEGIRNREHTMESLFPFKVRGVTAVTKFTTASKKAKSCEFAAVLIFLGRRRVRW